MIPHLICNTQYLENGTSLGGMRQVWGLNPRPLAGSRYFGRHMESVPPKVDSESYRSLGLGALYLESLDTIPSFIQAPMEVKSEELHRLIL